MKKLSFLLTILLSLNIFTINAYSNNNGSIIGTLNGVEYFADGNTAPVKLNYSYNNNNEYSLWSSQKPTDIEDQFIKSQTFYRSSTVKNWIWNAHTDSASSTSGCPKEGEGNKYCNCARDNYSKTKDQATAEAIVHEYWKVENDNWVESYEELRDHNEPKKACSTDKYFTINPNNGENLDAECRDACARDSESCGFRGRYCSDKVGYTPYYSGICRGRSFNCSGGTGMSPRFEYYEQCKDDMVHCVQCACQCNKEINEDHWVKRCANKTVTHYDFKVGYVERKQTDRWSAWSAWTTTPIQETAEMKVEYVELYSYPVTYKYQYSAFATGDEFVNFGTYNYETYEYIPFAYNSKTYYYYYVPALKVCRIKPADSADQKYVSQKVIQVWLNDVAPSARKGQLFTLTTTIFGIDGNTYQWQSSTDGNNWTNIEGATSASATFTANVNGTKYRCVVNGEFYSNIATLLAKD